MNPRLFIILLCATGALFSAALRAADEGRRQPITIEADGAVFDERKGESTYTGHVRVTQGELTIHAQQVTVYIEDEQLQRIVATGEPVHFRQRREGEEDILGEARRLNYDAKTERLLLLDQAWLRQGVNRFSGKRIQYDTQQAQVTASQGEDGSQRVKVIIQPKEPSHPKAPGKGGESGQP